MKITYKRILMLCIFVLMLMSLTACANEKNNRNEVTPSTQYTIEFVEATGYNSDEEISYNNAIRVTSVGEYPFRMTVRINAIAVEPSFFPGEFVFTQKIEVGVGESELITYGNPYVFLTNEFTVDAVTLLNKPAQVINLSVLTTIFVIIFGILALCITATTEPALFRANVCGGLAMTVITMLLIMGAIELFSADSVTFIIYGLKFF